MGKRQQVDDDSKNAADVFLKIKALARAYFDGDEGKVRLWLMLPNPLFGNMSPQQMIDVGRADMVLRVAEGEHRA